MNDLIAAVSIAVASIAAALTVARLAARVVMVSGPSMEPTLLAGSRVLALRGWPGRWLRPGHVVLLRGLPGTGVEGLIVKRVAHVGGETAVVPATHWHYASPLYARLDTRRRPMQVVRLEPGEIFVIGDNPMSADSRDWGPMPIDAVAGLVLTWSAVPPRAGAPR